MYTILTCIVGNNNFNPRSPRGGATASPVDAYRSIDIFQSTLPTRGSDPLCNTE